MAEEKRASNLITFWPNLLDKARKRGRRRGGGSSVIRSPLPLRLLVEETYVHCCCCRLRRPTPNHVYHQLAGEACGRKQFHSLPTDTLGLLFLTLDQDKLFKSAKGLLRGYFKESCRKWKVQQN